MQNYSWNNLNSLIHIRSPTHSHPHSVAWELWTLFCHYKLCLIVKNNCGLDYCWKCTLDQYAFRRNEFRVRVTIFRIMQISNIIAAKKKKQMRHQPCLKPNVFVLCFVTLDKQWSVQSSYWHIFFNIIEAFLSQTELRPRRTLFMLSNNLKSTRIHY